MQVPGATPAPISYQKMSVQWFGDPSLGHVAHATTYSCRKGDLTKPSRHLKLISVLCSLTPNL